MTAWIAFRLIKFAGLVLFAGGVFGAIHSQTRARRLNLLYGLMVPGLTATCAGGWLLMKSTERSPSEPWIAAGLVAALLCLHGTFVSAHKTRASSVMPTLAVGGLIAAVGFMVARTASVPWLAGIGAMSLAAGALFAIPWSRDSEVGEDDQALVLDGFRWVARAEGATLLFMLAVSIPLRVGAGIDLDGETEVIGWIHGVIFAVYLQSLSSTSRDLDWSWGAWVLAFLAAFLPAGTFIFEWRLDAITGRA